jgi:hypothetical protein
MVGKTAIRITAAIGLIVGLASLAWGSKATLQPDPYSLRHAYYNPKDCLQNAERMHCKVILIEFSQTHIAGTPYRAVQNSAPQQPDDAPQSNFPKEKKNRYIFNPANCKPPNPNGRLWKCKNVDISEAN